MGDYTELKTNFHLKSTTSTEVINILQYIANEKSDIPALPEHSLFKCPRWKELFDSTSSSINIGSCAEVYNSDTRYHIQTQSNFKNYSREVQLFWDWISPYIDSPIGKQLGEITTDDTVELVLMGENHNVVFLRQDNKEDHYFWEGI
ncbi:MAG: hypothetical protein ACE3L7_32830 [Candidatus Pristimantibacillus sp.]